jgi:hypothetical protein
VTDAERQPAEFWRVALAFAVAPIPSILVFTLIENGFQGFGRGIYLIAALGAYPPLLLLGLPLYVLLHREVRPRLALTCILAGVVAVLPWLLVVSLMSFQPLSNNEKVGSVFVVENGRLTLAGLWLHMQFLAKVFALGALAGAVFWMIASRRVQPG